MLAVGLAVSLAVDLVWLVLASWTVGLAVDLVRVRVKGKGEGKGKG